MFDSIRRVGDEGGGWRDYEEFKKDIIFGVIFWLIN